MSNVAINFTPTGMVPTKHMTPHVPISVEEIVEDVHKATEIGITMVHLHARDQRSGKPTCKAEVYEDIISGIRRYASELIICVSLSGRDFKTFEERSAPLKLDGWNKPDMGSLTLSSLNFNRQASINEPEMIQRLASEMLEKGIIPELEAFDSGMVNYAKYLAKKGYITPPYYFNLIVGNIASSQADPLHVGVMINELPDDSCWSVGGIGDVQNSANMMAIAAGGGVRIGLEDNIFRNREKTKLATNCELLERIHNIIQIAEKSYIKPREMREKLGLQSGAGGYGKANE